MKRYIALLALLILNVMITITHAQTSLVYAAVVDDNLFIFGLAEQPIQVTFNEFEPAFSSSSIMHARWNNDGSLLAFVQRNAARGDDGFFIVSHDIVVVNLATSVIYPLEVQVSPIFPISFLPDGRLMFAQEGGYVESSITSQIINVFAIVPDGESQPEQIGRFLFGVGCGGGSPFPTDAIYWEETGFGGNPLFIASTSVGIIHTPICSGQGISLLAPDGNSIPLNSDITRVKLSPDGNRLLGIAGDDLLIYDLMTQTEQRIDIQSVPDQVAWGPQGSNDVYYSVVTEGPTLRFDDAQAAIISGTVGFDLTEISTFGLNIRRYNVTSRDDVPIYGGFGSAIGRMQVTADGSQLIFSVVPNLNAWVDAILAGEFGTSATSTYLIERALLPVDIVALDLASGNSTVIGTGQQQFTLR